MKILAIDDIRDNLQTLKALLKAFLPEAHLKTAGSAAHGIACARSDPPDVILLDIQMPGMDGFEATRRLKSTASTHHIPIILITAYLDDAGCKAKGLECGADAFLSKPIGEAELVAQIRAMYRIKKSEDALRRERDGLEQLVAVRIKEVYEKQRLNQLLLDAIPHYAYLISYDRKIVSYNRMAARQGAKEGAHCWLNIHQSLAVSPEHHAWFLDTGTPLPGTKCSFCLAERAMSTGKPAYAEVTLDGVCWDVWWVPIDDSMFLHYAEDVTQRRKLEEERHSLEKQLFHAQKLESIGTLAGGIAHDFNNVLSVISGYAALLQRELIDDNQCLSMVSEILKSSERAAEMTRSLLMFSSKQTLELKSDSLNQIMIGLSKTLKRLIREDISLEFELLGDDLPIIADRVQIEQVVMNLVVNARDAMPSGGRLTLETEMIVVSEKELHIYGVATPGRYAVLSVSDSGSGMDSQTVEHIFEPFFTTKELGKGTGLGLSISFAIVNKHNGAISVTSVPEKGSTFKMLLPLSGASTLPQHSDAVGDDLFGNEMVLVVEDDDSVRAMITLTLKKHGYSVIVAEDGESGLCSFIKEQNMIKLVVSDLIMPKKNGKEMSREIRALDATVPIIITSGYTDGLLDIGEIAEDKIYFIQKPLWAANLLKVVRTALDQSCHPPNMN